MTAKRWVLDDEKEAIFALTAELAALDGPAGFEGPVVRRLVELFRPLADEVTVDAFGNVIATRHGAGGAGSGPSLMIAAHSDEIGGIVRAFEADGMIRFERLGGVVETTLIGRRVRVGNPPGGGLRGVVGVRAGHVQSADEKLKAPPLRDLYIDLGFDSAAATRAAGITVGDPIAYESEVVRLANPDRISGKAIDNRIACAILLRLFARLRGIALGGTIHGVVTVQEEVGLRGAQVVTYRLNPDYAIVVDTLPAAGTPDVNYTKELAINIGAGPVIPLLSGGGGRGNIMHPALKRLLLDTAAREGITVQPAIFTQGNSDVAAVHLVREGIPAGVVNIPRRYSHTPVETADLNDAANALRLLEAVACDHKAGIKLDFLD